MNHELPAHTDAMESRPRTYTDIDQDDMTAEQLALRDSQPVFATTRYGVIQGGTVRNGARVFLNVPYAQDVPRWSDPKALSNEFHYDEKPYIVDGLYCAQPSRPLTAHVPVHQRLGLGQPTENPFFADIYAPSSITFPSASASFSDNPPAPSPLKPVRVFIHGGFLNYGSTSGQHYNQQFFAAEEFDEVRVLLGHRVSVFGFLASEKHGLHGNYGFKDCWVGLQWVKENIQAFGGDPDDIHLSGLSGGAHVLHQLLHHVAHLSPDPAPFISATLHSNAILTPPISAASRENQFEALARALGLNPTTGSEEDVLAHLRDDHKISTETLIRAVESLGPLSTFRGVAGNGKDGWNTEDQIKQQRRGELGRRLKAAGVRFVILGDVKDEVAFYATAYPCKSSRDILPYLEPFYGSTLSKRLLQAYGPPVDPESGAEADAIQGRILADGQVHLPIRLLARDLANGGLPVVRYTIEYAAKSATALSRGTVPHGSDLTLHHYRLSVLQPEEAKIALNFRQAMMQAVEEAIRTDTVSRRGEEEVLTLSRDGSVGWKEDWRWPLLRGAERAVLGW